MSDKWARNFRVANDSVSRLPALSFLKPRLLILDEVTSALDQDTEAAICTSVRDKPPLYSCRNHPSPGVDQCRRPGVPDSRRKSSEHWAAIA